MQYLYNCAKSLEVSFFVNNNQSDGGVVERSKVLNAIEKKKTTNSNTFCNIRNQLCIYKLLTA